MTKLYFTVVGMVLTYVAFLGFICPMLISSKTDEGPILGFALIIVLPIIFVLIGKSIYKQSKKLITKIEKQDEKA